MYSIPVLNNKYPPFLSSSTSTTGYSETIESNSRLNSSIWFSPSTRIPQHVSEMIQKLRKTSQLPDNWDSYGAITPNKEAVATALDFILQNLALDLPFYFLAPGVNGEIMLEFVKDSKSAELFFHPEGKTEIVLFDDDRLVFEGFSNSILKDLIQFFYA